MAWALLIVDEKHATLARRFNDTNTDIIRRRAGGGHVAQCSSTVCSLLSRCAFCDVWHCRGHVRRYTRIHADRRMCHGSKLHYSALALSGYGPDKRTTTGAAPGVASRRRGGRLFSAWHRFPLVTAPDSGLC